MTIGIICAATLAAGLLSLQSPLDPVSDPHFSILEVPTILLMPFMVAMMAAMYALGHRSDRTSSQ